MYLVGVTTCKIPTQFFKNTMYVYTNERCWSGLNSNMNLFHIFLSIYLLYYTEWKYNLHLT